MIRSTLAAFADSISVPKPNRTGRLTLTPNRVKIELLAGLTVALALVPEAVAFAFVAGVEPLVGLYAAFIVGLITALIGGRPGMISGATGALAVVMVALVADHGVEYLFATVVLMGIMQIGAGLFKLGKFIRLVPHPVMLGFVNGLAIVIGMAQLSQFQSAPPVRIPGEHYGPFHILEGTWLTGTPLILMLGLVVLTMFLIWVTPKVTKAIPAPLMGIGIVTALVIALKLDVQTVSDLASIKGGLPSVHIPAVPLNLETLQIIFPYALVLAAIGLIESLLTLNLVGEIKEERGGASQECVAQGLANTVTGFFGGMGGCAMIGQSMINVKSGGRTRLSGISASLFLLAFILFGSQFIGMIPLAALVGVMFMVVIGTFAWQSFTIMRRIPLIDALVIVLVTVVTVYHDLAVAVVVGVIVSALAYAWSAAKHIDAETEEDEDTKVYKIEGPLFFGSIEGFNDLFDVKGDPNTVIVDFANSRVVDQSALQAIEGLAAKYTQAGKAISLRHLTRDCHSLLNRAGQLIVDSDDDPEYEIATDYRVVTGVFGGGH
ncbi:sodium-independent anion transporter [Litorimonas cladophorae]|uniref:Sodium-independent anion transporter n=1 Tax=Litorimonas cladophorae TaxID=1220491 RepID=A0A918KQ14_9PROT|nr:SulP family inorganic anion transporter [Litorimonas cladophorae]GGX71679.1 sodium-independent anion transporter [Litorimonas cladophorae]